MFWTSQWSVHARESKLSWLASVRSPTFFFSVSFICLTFYNTSKFYSSITMQSSRTFWASRTSSVFVFNFTASSVMLCMITISWTLNSPALFVFTAAPIVQLLQVLYSTLLLAFGCRFLCLIIQSFSNMPCLFCFLPVCCMLEGKIWHPGTFFVCFLRTK